MHVRGWRCSLAETSGSQGGSVIMRAFCLCGHIPPFPASLEMYPSGLAVLLSLSRRSYHRVMVEWKFELTGNNRMLNTYRTRNSLFCQNPSLWMFLLILDWSWRERAVEQTKLSKFGHVQLWVSTRSYLKVRGGEGELLLFITPPPPWYCYQVIVKAGLRHMGIY